MSVTPPAYDPNMGSTPAGEGLPVKVFGIMRATAAKTLRGLRPDGVWVIGARRILDEVLAIEKALDGLKLLLADRAAEGSPRGGGQRSAEADLAQRSGTTVGEARRL